MLNKASSLRKFQRVTLRDEAYASIKQAILLSEFSQGQQLAIAALSEVTGLSATPIREALLMLEREGLVDRLPKGHFIVRRVSRQEVAEICQVRSLLEPFAARLALGNLKEPDIHHLEENVARSREALAEEDMALLTELNTEFHDYLNGLAKNETLNGITRLLREKVLQTRSTALWVPGKAKTAIRHTARRAKMSKAPPRKARAPINKSRIRPRRVNSISSSRSPVRDREPERGPLPDGPGTVR